MNKFGVVVFPGSNCDEDMVGVLESISGNSVEHLWHKEANLKNCDFIVLPGGFSYGDYLRTGCIAAKSKIIKEVKGSLSWNIDNWNQLHITIKSGDWDYIIFQKMFILNLNF